MIYEYFCVFIDDGYSLVVFSNIFSRGAAEVIDDYNITMRVFDHNIKIQ